MAKYDYDVIVIGGGAAGLTASTFAGQSAAKTLLIEKEKKLGGDCLHYGCVPSKSLIKSAYAYNVIRNSEKYGLPKAAITPVDYKRVSNRIREIIDTIQKHDEPEYLEEKFNVETQFGTANFIDNHTISLNGKNITSRYFVIGTGSSPFIPPIEGLKDIDYKTNIEIFTLDELPESLIVLGAGPIGMEMAQSFARLGSKVSVIEMAEQVLPREDADIATLVKEKLESEGIDFVLSSTATKVEQQNGKILVTVNNKQTGYNQVIEGATILVAVGRKPNVDGLDLEKAGVQYSPKGVKVDARLRTTAKNIYACGDVNGSFPFTHVASYEAVIAIKNALLKMFSKADYTYTPWCTYIDPEVASIGMNEKSAREAGIDYKLQKDELKGNDRALAEGETNGFLKMILNQKGKVLGVQIVGYHAGDLIAEWIPILNGKVSLSTISDAIHPYPTMSEINKTSSVNYLVSTVPGWTKNVLKIIFGYQGKV